jgi:hypothetical protein
MPNITLYRDDVEKLTSICKTLRNLKHEQGKKRILNDLDYDLITDCDRLADLLFDRLQQNCHPSRRKSK